MTARLPMTLVPEPRVERDAGIEGMPELVRVVNQNFAKIRDTIERNIITGGLIADGTITLAMLSTEAKTLVGDVTGLISATTVEKIRGKTVDAPGAGQDALLLAYNHANSDFDWVDALRDVLTTRGDLLYRGASAEARLAVGGANTVLKSDGTDPGWGSLSSLLDAVFSSSQGAILTRGAAAWGALAPGTSGHFLKSNGAGADLSYAAGGGGATSPLTTKGDVWGYSTADDRIPVGTDGKVLTADSAAALGVSWQTPGAAGSSALLDGTIHTDTVAAAVTRGSLIYGNSTPKWDELVLGSVGKRLTSDGTDAAWKFDRSVRANKPTVVETYFGNNITTNNGVLARTDPGGTTADAADADRVSNKYTQNTNGGSVGSTWASKVTPAMSPALWADFKIAGAGFMLLKIGFVTALGVAYGTGNQVQFAWADSDANFRFVHGATGGAPTDDDTGITKDANWHDVLLYSPDAGTTWILELDGVQTNSTTTAVPVTTTALVVCQGYGCDTAASAGNEVRFSYCVVQLVKPISTI